MTEKPRAAIYVRVSTSEQAEEGFSIASQLSRLRSFCEAREWEVAQEYIDGGHSGRTTKRPAYRQMMDEKDSWDTILVVKIDRIHRNSRNFLDMIDNLKEWEKDFASMTESFETSTAMGRFVANMIQSIAQLESEQIGERVTSGMVQKAREGLRPGSRAPYGYTHTDGYLIPNKDMAIVTKMFELRKSGRNYGQIAAYLNHRGVPAPRGGKWSRHTVSSVLKNPVYGGEVRWGGIEIKTSVQGMTCQ